MKRFLICWYLISYHGRSLTDDPLVLPTEMFSLYLHRVTDSCAANKNVCWRRLEALFTTPEEQKHLKCQVLSLRVQTGICIVQMSYAQNRTLAPRLSFATLRGDMRVS